MKLTTKKRNHVWIGDVYKEYDATLYEDSYQAYKVASIIYEDAHLLYSKLLGVYYVACDGWVMRNLMDHSDYIIIDDKGV